MKHTAAALSLVIAIFCIFSCQKNDSNQYYYFNETGCNNPWQDFYTADTFSQGAVLESIERFLSHERINYQQVSMTVDSSQMQFCYACHCQTGNVVVVEASTACQNKLRNLGFYD